MDAGPADSPAEPRQRGIVVSSRLRILIRAGPDLELEREVIGKAIASLPVSLGWVIKYTPGRGEPLAPALEAVTDSHFYVLLLGRDIRAPVGSELHIARKSGKMVLAFLNDVSRTPAAHVFVRDSSVEWTRFRGADELEPLLQKALVEQILEEAQTYGISPIDWETLSALLADLEGREGPEREGEEVASGYRGAGTGAVIVAPGKDLPPGGVLVEKPEAPS
jgi:hypothetical protein